jgi:hypothetical protein
VSDKQKKSETTERKGQDTHSVAVSWSMIFCNSAGVIGTASLMFSIFIILSTVCNNSKAVVVVVGVVFVVVELLVVVLCYNGISSSSCTSETKRRYRIDRYSSDQVIKPTTKESAPRSLVNEL